LGLIQGATEFIPVSSSGHLVLVPWLLGWPAPEIVFDTVVHLGTLAALLAVFWRELLRLASACVLSISSRVRRTGGNDSRLSSDARVGWWIALGTLPAAVIGWLLEDWFERLFATPPAAAGFLLVTAGILSASERWGRRHKTLEDMSLVDALLIGVAQAAAIAPGISRSGATMAMGLARGLRREVSARYAFLLATPIVFGAGIYKLTDLIGVGGASQQVPSLLVGFVASAVSGYLCIRYLLRYLQRGRLYVFASYCAAAGAAALLVHVLR
jgi:undecaprenyl-diphosphatase